MPRPSEVARLWRHATQVTDKTHTTRYLSPNHDPDLVHRVETALAKIPADLRSGLREVVIFPPERASLYVGPGADGEYQANARTVMVSATPRLDSIEGIVAHEVGHHVADHILAQEARVHLQQVLGARTEDWNEDFASCFGFYFSGRRTEAEREFPVSFEILRPLL